MSGKKFAIFMMSAVVCIWGAEYSVAKTLMEAFSPVNVLLFKYTVCLACMAVIRFTLVKGVKTSPKDYLHFMVATFSGIVLYFLFDYKAMDYMPISLVTIVLAFVPVVSIIIDRIVFKRKMTARIILGVAGSVIGVAIVIGPDIGLLMQGRIIGYVLAFGAVLSWNAYNFLAEPLSKKYPPIVVAFNQVFCAFLLVLPLQLTALPDLSKFTPSMVIGVLYLGILSGVIGYMTMPLGLKHLGPTISGVFSNFLPISSTFFAWVILGESMGPVQLAGGAVVIGFSCMVIIEINKRNRIEEQEAER